MRMWAAFFALFIVIVPMAVRAADPGTDGALIVAGKNYVDSAMGKLAPVAFSGSYNDLTDKPIGGGNGAGALYEVRSNSISGAATGATFQVEMDGWVFRGTKQSITAYWALRFVNNTGGAVPVMVKGHHNYAAAVAQAGKYTILPVGGEINPDNEDGDIGYDNSTIFTAELFDPLNLHMYRVTMPVQNGSAIIIVEKLH